MEGLSHQNSEELLVALFKAYFEARKNKRNNLNQLRFEVEYEANILSLYYEIMNKTYRVSPGIAFIIHEPLKREILAANFRDRVVHHLIFQILNPIVEKSFIESSFSCRKGKGTHRGIQTLYDDILKCSKSYKEDCYVLKLDISGYFMSIHKESLKKLVFHHIDGDTHLSSDWKTVLYFLIRTILEDDPTETCRIKGRAADWEGLPRKKSLFHSPKGFGLPIGNLTSQLFSNIYLNRLDQYVKYDLGVQFYGRYVDDFYLVHRSRQVLLDYIPLIKAFLKSELQLTLHPAKIYLQHYAKGVHFLGAVLKPHRTYISNKTKQFFTQKIRYKLFQFGLEEPDIIKIYNFNAMVNSYLGLLRHRRAFNIIKKNLFSKDAQIFLKYGFLRQIKHKYVIYNLYVKYRK